jgi:hypothetical protein
VAATPSLRNAALEGTHIYEWNYTVCTTVLETVILTVVIMGTLVIVGRLGSRRGFEVFEDLWFYGGCLEVENDLCVGVRV